MSRPIGLVVDARLRLKMIKLNQYCTGQWFSSAFVSNNPGSFILRRTQYKSSSSHLLILHQSTPAIMSLEKQLIPTLIILPPTAPLLIDLKQNKRLAWSTINEPTFQTRKMCLIKSSWFISASFSTSFLFTSLSLKLYRD